MLDEILDFLDRRKRQHEAEHPRSPRSAGLPFDLPFLQDDDEEDRDRQRHDDRRPARRSSDHRTGRDGDWF